VGMAASASASDDEEWAVGSGMAGAVAGLGAGHYLLRGHDFTTGEGVLINIGEVAGGLLGAGLLYITGTDTDPAWPYLLASSTGATAGLWATYLSLGGRARTHGSESSQSSLRLDICPEGLLACAGARLGDSKARAVTGRPAPILRLAYRF